MITVYKIDDNYAAVGIDEYPCMDSPRVECENLGTFITWMNRYESPDRNEYDTIEEFYDYNGISGSTCLIPGLAKMVIMPVYCMAHSVVRYSTKSFGCPWDSGFAGFIYVSYEDIRKDYGCKYVTKRIIQMVKDVLQSEVKAYDQWANDPSYEITIFDTKGDVVDSMGGFYEVEVLLDDFGISEKDHIGDYVNEDKLIIDILKKEI
ncbi:MAG: hypothetical protein WCS15_11095 [Prevotella sp.]